MGILQFSTWNVVTVVHPHKLDILCPPPYPSLLYLEPEVLFLVFFVVQAEPLGSSLAGAGG